MPATAPQCGGIVSSGRPYAAAPERAVREAKNQARTIILSNGSSALAPREQLIVRSPADERYRMISARELEPAGGYRFVLTAEAAKAESGTVKVTQRLLAFSRTTRLPVRELRFDPTTIRSKLGQRPIAIFFDRGGASERQLMHASPAALADALAAAMTGTGSLPGNLADGFQGGLGLDCSGRLASSEHPSWHARIGRDSRTLSPLSA